ncbi:AsmA-like C-terminal region-containing protein [Candidatus Pelagibacter communis]|uniref:AsmA-like C-terminal region-containing protein n=1 Tax=Pelagibacter ubique TaxID=198252 RepID=UPI00094CD2FC|nr:AsmA-like C-terminal region-containing protein [Candidatus Pelagibacter ubique]
MTKIIYRTTITIIFILLVTALYLSTIGIKTKKFNSQIISQIKKYDPNLNLKINHVSAKLNLFKFNIDAKTVGTDVIYRNKVIKIENIKSKISIKSFIENQFALSEISISTKSLPLKELIGFIRIFNNDTKLLILEQLINNGYIVADLKLEFDKSGKIKKNYKIKGFVNDGQISILKKKVSKLNFIFDFSDKKFIFNEINLLLNNKKIIVQELIASKLENEFLVSGKLNSKNLNLKKEDLKQLVQNQFFNENFDETKFSADSSFNFKIDKNFKFQNFDIKSNIDVNFLKLKQFFKLKNNFPKMKDYVLLENQKIKLNYKKDKLEIIGGGNLLIQEEPDKIEYRILNNKDKFDFDLNLEIFKNIFIIDLLNYEKEKKSTLNLSIKGKKNKNEILFKDILLSEKENFFSIKNLKLSKNYTIDDIGNIKINYLDKEKFNNDLQIKKDKKNYLITGNNLNINKIITDLLDSKGTKKNKIFSNNFKIFLDINTIYLDKINSSYDLNGFLSINNNEISELNLVSVFSDNKKVKFTINTTDNNEKITTLFSEKAKPLVDRYKFIKGFNEGSIDFYSIKKNDVTKSTIKIYDFKLKELPALTKLLTLASLQGIADLLSGEGIRFNDFEMNFTNKDNLMTIDEIYAIGPAISILMEGYVEKNSLISLRGTLVPATTINKTISSIPILGSILVGEKVGEGVFGVSFKIKGPPNNLETTVNPIKTLTPRFITRTLEKLKKN